MVELGNYLQAKVPTIESFQEFCTLLLVEKVTEVADIKKTSALYTGLPTSALSNTAAKNNSSTSTKDYTSSSKKDSTSTKDYSSSSNKKDGKKSEIKRKCSPSKERNSKDSKEQRSNQNKSNSNSVDIPRFETSAAEHHLVVEKVKGDDINE
jgi:Mg-chelatase subunit ChlI